MKLLVKHTSTDLQPEAQPFQSAMSTWAGPRAWPHVTATSMLLLLSTCSLVASLAPYNFDSEPRDEETSPASDHFGSSRGAVFGSPARRKPQWLYPLFKANITNKHDGLMAGVAIRLDAYHLLMHIESHLFIADDFWDPNYRWQAQATIGFEHGLEFNASNPSLKWTWYVPSHEMTIGHNIAIFSMPRKITRKRDSPKPTNSSDATRIVAPLAASGNFDKTQISWRGCYVLTWGSWNGSSGFDFSLRKVAVRDSDHPETPGNCNVGLCQMNLVHDENTGGKLCGLISALGAPVICSSKKIEFVVASYNASESEGGCTYQFGALRLDVNRRFIELTLRDLEEVRRLDLLSDGIRVGP